MEEVRRYQCVASACRLRNTRPSHASVRVRVGEYRGMGPAHHQNLVHLTGRRLDGLIVTTMTRSVLDSDSECTRTMVRNGSRSIVSQT